MVDDHLMGITHVIRGEEWLPSAPLHVLLYQYLGWADTMPEFAHLPLLLKPDGNGKLSKRDGDKHGFPVFPLDWKPEEGEGAMGFREQGYLPEAMVNFLALLGWSPGDNRELFTLEELCQAFSLERIGKAGAKFDIEKGRWFQAHYLREKSAAELGLMLQDQARANGVDCPADRAARIADMLRDRITFPQELWEGGAFLFSVPSAYDPQVAGKKWNETAVQAAEAYATALEGQASIDAEGAKSLLEAELAKLEIGLGKVMQAMRLAITGMGQGPDLMEIISLLGPSETAARLRSAVKTLTVGENVKS